MTGPVDYLVGGVLCVAFVVIWAGLVIWKHGRGYPYDDWPERHA